MKIGRQETGERRRGRVSDLSEIVAKSWMVVFLEVHTKAQRTRAQCTYPHRTKFHRQRSKAKKKSAAACVFHTVCMLVRGGGGEGFEVGLYVCASFTYISLHTHTSTLFITGQKCNFQPQGIKYSFVKSSVRACVRAQEIEMNATSSDYLIA